MMEFIDFKTLRRSDNMDVLFPDWAQGETVAFFSPHDDDIVLGAGYLLLATVENKGRPLVFIFCRGDAGYSTPREKASIVSTRRHEALSAYQELGVEKRNVFFFGIPDFCLMESVSRTGRSGKFLFERIIKIFRAEKISRVVFPSGHYEHWDHTAAFFQGIYTSPQAGDPVLADLGAPYAARTRLVYSVWGDFEPSNAEGQLNSAPADKGILAKEKYEATVRAALGHFVSQGRIMGKTVANLRNQRKCETGYLELYKEAVLRKPIDFGRYFQMLKSCRKIS